MSMMSRNFSVGFMILLFKGKVLPLKLGSLAKLFKYSLASYVY